MELELRSVMLDCGLQVFLAGMGMGLNGLQHLQRPNLCEAALFEEFEVELVRSRGRLHGTFGGFHLVPAGTDSGPRGSDLGDDAVHLSDFEKLGLPHLRAALALQSAIAEPKPSEKGKRE